MTRFWSPLAVPAGRMPGTMSTKSRPHALRKAAISSGEQMTPSRPLSRASAAGRRPRAAGHRANQASGFGKVDRVDGAVDGIGAAGHGGRNLRAVVLPGKRSLFSRYRLGVRALPQLVDMKIDQSARRLPRKT